MTGGGESYTLMLMTRPALYGAGVCPKAVTGSVPPLIAQGVNNDKNPYADSESLAELLWETEMVAEGYAKGGLILIRTKDGWRAFLGILENDELREMENALDKNVPSYEKAFGEMSRQPNWIDELERLLPDCMCFPGYRPMKLVEEIEGDD